MLPGVCCSQILFGLFANGFEKMQSRNGISEQGTVKLLHLRQKPEIMMVDRLAEVYVNESDARQNN